VLAAVARITRVVDLPVTVDIETGYDQTPPHSSPTQWDARRLIWRRALMVSIRSGWMIARRCVRAVTLPRWHRILRMQMCSSYSCPAEPCPFVYVVAGIAGVGTPIFY